MLKISIPERLDEIKVGDWMKYRQVCKMDDFDDEVDQLALVTIFCGLTIDQARSIEAREFKRIVTQISNVLLQEPRFVQRFLIGGREYGFIPNLEVMSQGELIDLDAMLENEDTYPEAMAIMYRPIEGKIPSWVRRLFLKSARKKWAYYKKFLNMYNIEDYTDSHIERNAPKMLDVNLEVMFGSQVFFYRLGKDLLAIVPSYLETELQTLTTLQREALSKSGAGISQFLLSLEAINLNLTRPPS